MSEWLLTVQPKCTSFYLGPPTTSDCAKMYLKSRGIMYVEIVCLLRCFRQLKSLLRRHVLLAKRLRLDAERGSACATTSDRWVIVRHTQMSS